MSVMTTDNWTGCKEVITKAAQEVIKRKKLKLEEISGMMGNVQGLSPKRPTI